jgi:MFS family permease
VCAAAPSPLALDLGRAAQGAGAAALFASSLALLGAAYAGEQRARALATWGALTGLAMAAGPVIGGVLVDGPGWRWVFAVNVPAVAALGLATVRAVAESRGGGAARRADWPGLALFGSASALLVLALVEGEPRGWDDVLVVGAFAAAAALLVAGVAHERRTAAPMVERALLREPAVGGVALVAFGQSIALYPQFLFLAVVFQSHLGASPLEAGLWLLPATGVLLAVAPLSGRLTARLPLRTLLVAGLVLIAAAMLVLRAPAVVDSWTVLLPGLLLAGVAIGTISPALAAAMLAVLPEERSGLASGLSNTARQLGIAVGVAGFGAAFAAADGPVAGLDVVLALAAGAAVLTALAAWPLLGAMKTS